MLAIRYLTELKLTLIKAKLEKDIQALKESSETRRAEASQRDMNESAAMDVSMEGLRSAGSVDV